MLFRSPGRENARQFLKENQDMAMTVDTDLRKKLGLPALVVAADKAVAKSKASAS